MGKMILCRTKTSTRPLLIRDVGLKVYSLEELAYIIYNNIYLMNMDFFSDELLDFIENGVGEPELATKLAKMKRERADLVSLIVALLTYVDFYTIDEIEKIKGALSTLKNDNVLLRLKTRADACFDHESYLSAVDNYLKIIRAPRDPKLTGIFYSEIYHNAAACFARLMMYDKALDYYKQAYKIGHHKESLDCAILCARLYQGNHYIERDDASPVELKVKRDYEACLDRARLSQEFQDLDEIISNKSENIDEYRKKLDEKVIEFKDRYLRMNS